MFFTIIILLTGFNPVKEAIYKPVVVLELFTSQGCSSCPPADKLLGEVSNTYSNDEVVALSYHVDYWNYIGWKDPFSKKAYSNKQRQYGSKFASSSIYTPQVVINGKTHFVGSKRDVMTSKLKAYLGKKSENEIILSRLENNSGLLSFNYKINGNIAAKKIRFVLAIKERVTAVGRGENRNRVLKNYNIVVKDIVNNLDANTGTSHIEIPELVNNTDKLMLVALVQTKDLSIVGASQVKL